MKPLKSLFILLALSVATLSVKAQTSIKRLSGINDSIKNTMLTTVFDGADVIHISLKKGLFEYQPIIEIGIDGNLYRFMFDTGCSQTTFNSRYVPWTADDSIYTIYRVESHGAIYDITGIARIDNLKLGELDIDSLLVALMDMGEVGTSYGNHCVLGMAQFVNYDILFDWKGKAITLVRPLLTDSIISSQYKVISNIPVTVDNYTHTIYVDTQVRSRFKTHQYKLTLDTGAEPCIIPEEAKPFLYRPSFNVIGGKRPKVGRTTIKIGDKKYRYVRTVLATPSFYQNKVGVLGLKVIGKHPFLLSTQNNRLLILKEK